MRQQIRQHEGVVPNSIQIQGLEYDERELSLSTSIISLDDDYLSKDILDDLDRIYTHRSHQRCMTLTYLTLLTMTLAVVSWMFYWLLYNHCEKLLAIERKNSLTCEFVFPFQILIFIFLGSSTIFFILMIILWFVFACRNPLDRIRTNFIAFRLEGVAWQNQLDCYFKQHSRCLDFVRRKRLFDRNFGYIILSLHGILFDELFLETSREKIIINGQFLEHERILKLECKKNDLLIHLSEELISRNIIEELQRTLKIPISSHNIPPARF
ncbi:unnamed protein product [Adineta ricciae]|uniref:Uncharacterized protein n=1 Tax=Adineta ricciae TaxID=249248 RepID=A0A814L5J4_ADIRI|nr:unnamed protein product [Adineta ricciae]